MEGIGYFGRGVVGVEGKLGGLCSLRSHHNEGRVDCVGKFVVGGKKVEGNCRKL